MMGESESQSPLWNYRVNLDKRVRSDHPLRRINGVLNLSFVRAQVAHAYGRRGNKSVPPEVIMRMMLLLFLEDIKTERELMRIIPERLDYLWFLSYGLDDEVPDHSVLSKARKRWGKEVFLALFSRVVQQCVEAGLVGGDKIHVDASLVDANGFFTNLNHPPKEKIILPIRIKNCTFRATRRKNTAPPDRRPVVVCERGD